MYSTSKQTAANTQPQRILVVDDDRALRMHACEVLRAAGMQPFEAASGEQALALLEAECVDAVLLDIRMPGMDGFETCRRIRELRRGEFLPVIVVTGHGDMQAVEAAYRAGATDFVIKPIDWVILKERIRYTMNARRLAEDLVADSAHLCGVLHNAPDAVLRLDRRGRVVQVRHVNPERNVVARLFRVGELLTESLPPAAARRAGAAMRALSEGAGQTSFDFDMRMQDTVHHFEVYLASGAGADLVAQVRDHTARRHKEEEMRRLAFYDRVTGLPNRELLMQCIVERLAREGEGEGLVSLMRLELQGLDYTRSLLGSGHVDDLLRQCTDRLVRSIGEHSIPALSEPGILGRVSDGGFAVLREDLHSVDRLQTFAHDLHDRIVGSYVLGHYEINITARIGVATASTGSDADAGVLFDRAEMAMAESRGAPAFFSSQTSSQRRERAHLVKELQAAVNNGDLHLEYQPKVETVDRRLLGLEALARWDHPSRGAVSPEQFIPLAEENGLILPLGAFVLEEACRQSRAWRSSGLTAVPVAVNFSGHQFSQKGLVGSLMRTLGDYDIGEGEIEIELTESVAMEHCNGISAVLQELHDIGIRTAIDDFGTGYSSLNNLRHFQFHTLKIDRSFIADLDSRPSAPSIIRGIIDMGHALGMQVVAEGVEKDHQMDYLRDQRCDLVQGYLTGRPARPEKIEPLLSLQGAG